METESAGARENGSVSPENVLLAFLNKNEEYVLSKAIKNGLAPRIIKNLETECLASLVPLEMKLVMEVGSGKEIEEIGDVAEKLVSLETYATTILDSLKNKNFFAALSMMIIFKAYHFDRHTKEDTGCVSIPPSDCEKGFSEFTRVLAYLCQQNEEHARFLIDQALEDAWWDDDFSKKYIIWCLDLLNNPISKQ